MDNPDPRGAVSSILAIMRKITRAVQLLPFAYLLLLAVYILVECFLPEWILRVADNVLNAPIIAIAGLLGVGRVLKLCGWFKAACLMPIATKVTSYIDSFIVTFTQNEAIIVNSAIGIAFLTFIYLSFRHFFHGHEGNSQRNIPVRDIQAG